MAQTNLLLRVDGMTCQGCVRSVEMTLAKRGGIASAQVNLEAGQASVKYDDVRTNPDQMIAALKEIGYETSREPVRR